MLDIQEKLVEFDLFQNLPPETLSALVQHTRTQTLARGRAVFHNGDRAAAFYVVLQGAVQIVEYSPNGKRVCLELNTVGDIFGLLALVGDKPYPHSAYTVTSTQLMSISHEDAQTLIHEHPAFAQCVIHMLVGRVHRANARLKQLATEQADQRLARTLLYYAGQFAKHAPLDAPNVLPISQQDLADFTGITLETVNRTLRLWEQQNWVRCARKKVELVDKPALEAHIKN